MFQKRGVSEKGFFARHKLWMAISTLVGTIVGAGILGLPYVISKVGFVYGSVLIVLLGLAFLLLNLCMGEIVLRTRQQHQLTGYAAKYLGQKGKWIMTLTLILSIYGALTAYLIGEGETLHAIFGGSSLLYTLIFFLINFFIIVQGMKATGKAEFVLLILLLFITMVIGFVSYDKIKVMHLTTFHFFQLFVPYGVILFALVGTPAIPEMQEVLGAEKKRMKKAIIIGSCIPIILYVLFTLVIMGLVSVGQFEALAANQRIATIALSIYASPLLGLFANILAVLTMFTSFLTLGIALLEMYEYDYGFSRHTALWLVFTIPLVIALFNLTTFLAVLGITGAVAGGLDGILITLMYWKAKKTGDRKPEYTLKPHKILGYGLIIVFALGIVYQLWINFF